MAEGVIKKILAAELQQQILDDNIEVYPVTATSAVFDSKTNQSLDDILSSINTRIIQAAASGGGGGTISIAGQTYVWAFAGFKGDSDAIADIQEKANNRGIPSGWQESSNVKLAEGEMLYMTTARKQGDNWLTWTDGSIWSLPVRLGSSGTTSGTGSDGQGYNYIYCRTSTGQMPSFQVSIEDTTLVNAVEDASKYNQGISVREVGGNVAYVQSTDPTDVWYDHPDGVTATIPYEWILVYQSNEEEWVLLTPQPILWSKYGVNGQDGDGVEYVFCAVSEGQDAPTIVKNNTITGTVNGTKHTVDVSAISTNEYYQQDDFIPEDWSDEPVQVDQDNPRQYVSIRKKKWVANEEKSKWGLFTEPKIWTEIPIVKAGADRLSLDWSNNNVNVVQGETGKELIDATTNYLSVKIGSTPIPYTETLPEQGLGYTLTISESSYYKAKLTSIDQETDGSILVPMGGVQLTELLTNAHTFAVSVTVKVKYNEDSDDIYTQIASFNVNVKDEVYEIIASPTGFNLSAIDTKSQEPLTVRVQRRNSTQATRFLTQAEITSLGTLQYTYKPSEKTTKLKGTSQETEFTIPCDADNALSGQRQIYLEFNSNARGYEDSETIMIARDGNTGDEGNGIEYIFRLATEDLVWVNDPGDSRYNDNPANWAISQKPDHIVEGSGWTDDLQEVTESNPVQYVSVRRFKKHGGATTKAWGAFEKPVVYNRWVPSPYSMSISNDSVIIDDNTDSTTLANASFCQLHIFSGQEEITTNEEYTFEITPLANNGANSIFNLYQASKVEISTINNFELINGNGGTPKSFGGSIPITGAISNTNGGIAFYIKRTNQDAALQINSYGIQYQVIIKKAGSQVASLYKVQPIKVANFSADGTIYKLNITNDTWTYNGDDNTLVSSISSIVTVAQIKGATANPMTFSIGDGDSSNGFHVKTNLVDGTIEGQQSYQIEAIKGNQDKYNTYSVSSHSLELYFNGTLVDAETIDCRKDGKTGAAGSSCYLTCDNDNIIVDLEATIADLNLLSAYTLQLWEQNIPIQDNDVKYSVEVPIEKTGGIYAYAGADGNYKEGCFSCGSMPTAPVSFQATAKAEYNKQEYTKTINITIKQLQGEPGGPGVSYKLVVSPNSLHYDGNKGIITGNSYRPICTVTKISGGTVTAIAESDLDDEKLSIDVNPTITDNTDALYEETGYTYTLKLDGTIVDQEHVDCLKDGKQGGTGPTGPEGNTTNVNGGFYVNFQDADGPSLNFNFTASSVKYPITNVSLTFQGSREIDKVYDFTINNKSTITASGKLSYSNIHSVDNNSCWEFKGISTLNTSGFAWGNYTTLTVKITMSNSSTTEHTIYRTGTDGYYFDSNSKGFISAYSSSDNLFKFAKTDVITYDANNHWQPSAYNLDIGKETYYHTLTFSNCQSTYSSYYYYGESDQIGSGEEDVELFFFDKGTVSKVADGCTLVSCIPNSTGTVYTVKISLHNIQCDTFNNFNISSPNQCGTLKCLKVSTTCTSSVSAYTRENDSSRKSITEGIYTVSAYVRPISSSNFAPLRINIEKFDGDTTIDVLNTYSVTPTNTNWENWQRIYTTFRVNQACEFNTLIVAQQNTIKYAYYGIYITGVQLVKGATPEPWSPYGNSMSMLLQNENSITQTVSQVTDHDTKISQISQQATQIQMTVNRAGLTVTDTGTTFTGDVNATNFNVCDSQNRAVMQVLVATQELTLDNSSKIAIGEPYIKLNTYNDNGTITSKYVGLYNLKDSTATDRLTYTTTTYLGVPTSAIDKTNPKIDSSRSYYTLISKIKLDGIGVTNINIDSSNHDIYNNQVWVQANSASATVSGQQVSCTGDYVSNPFVLTTKCNTLSQPNYYVVKNDIIYPITKLTYGDRIQIDNSSTMLSIRTYWVCGVCAIESAIGIAYWLNYRQSSFTGELAGQSSIKLMTIPGYFEIVNSIEDSSFPLFMENL